MQFTFVVIYKNKAAPKLSLVFQNSYFKSKKKKKNHQDFRGVLKDPSFMLSTHQSIELFRCSWFLYVR